VHSTLNPSSPRASSTRSTCRSCVDLGASLVGLSEGVAESELEIAPRHGQQDGFVHAGVIATLADHTAGAAAGTTCGRIRAC
jgi:acyl-coenzyme A thioesterase PaaI-like protein